jgi:putative CocE/NonD family hydrolase
MTAVSRVLARFADLAPAATEDVTVQRDLPMTAAPGVVLLADRWSPTGVDPTTLPVVLLRSPYGRRQLGFVGRLMAERGYQVVIQSCRGSFGSGGEWDPFRNEEADGRTALEWLADQPWWSGTVGTFGASYLGLTQWAVATDPPASLRAIALNVTASRFRDIVVFPGGSFTLETGATWLHLLEHQELGWRGIAAAQVRSKRALRPAYTTLPLARAEQAVLGREVGYYQQWLAHDRVGDPWWDPVDFSGDVSRVPPATLVGGWYDIFLPAQVDDYVALREAGREARLTIGPWTHSSARSAAAALRDGLEWFDVHLRGRRRAARRYPVRLWVVGRDQWVDVASWPPPSVPEAWFLQSEGRLSRTPPDPSPPDRYRYDPADPTPGVGGPSLNARSSGPKDQRRRERRGDVVTYTSAPMSVPVTVAGPVHAEVWFRPTADDTDVFLRLCVVSRRGRSTNLSDGILRIAPVEGGRPGEVASTGSREWGVAERTADGAVRVRVRMWPVAATFDTGQSIRLQVSAGAHPLFARNLGSGEPLGSGTRLVAVDHEILHDPEHPSFIELPLSSI